MHKSIFTCVSKKINVFFLVGTAAAQYRSSAPFAMPTLPCLISSALPREVTDIVDFKNNDKINYNAKEKAALVSKDGFVPLKDGKSKIVIKVLSSSGKAVDLSHLELVAKKPSDLLTKVSKIVIVAVDAKTNKEKKTVFLPNKQSAANPMPNAVLLSNLMLLKDIQGLKTKVISLTVYKIGNKKLSVRLNIKICSKLRSTTPATSK